MRSELDFILRELAQYIINGDENIKGAYKEEIEKIFIGALERSDMGGYIGQV